MARGGRRPSVVAHPLLQDLPDPASADSARDQQQHEPEHDEHPGDEGLENVGLEVDEEPETDAQCAGEVREPCGSTPAARELDIHTGKSSLELRRGAGRG